MKRIIDLLLSAIFLILLFPLLFGIGCVIWLDDGFPVFYKQRRAGLNGRLFSIYKFRSMVKNAESLGSFRTGKNDPRITKLGQFLRRTSLDELPQLWNVLIGDMSLVGPRPFSPEQAFDYSASDWSSRHSVRPGITGLAQISGRSGIDRHEKMRHDLVYVKKHNLALDLSILARTVIFLFTQRDLSN